MLKCKMKIFYVIMLFSTIASCSSLVVVTPPDLDFKINMKEIKFVPPKKFESKIFVPKDGKNKLTQDNITVEIDSVLSELDLKDYTISITEPNLDGFEKQHTYGLFPRIVIIKIHNNTDHIVKLKNTIIRLEDSNKNEFPLISNVGESKRILTNRIANAYDTFVKRLKDKAINGYVEKLNSEYRPKYDAMVEEIDRLHKNGYGIRTPDMKEGRYKTEYGIKVMLDEYAPKTLYNKYLPQMEAVLAQMSDYINKKKYEALKNINELPEFIKNVITNGIYPAINVLPGRNEKILVPFKTEKTINSVHINIFDLPTQVDEAGITIKRANFYFEMVAKSIN